ncbi:hypothetical protein HKX48_009089 [Thoreauomyces humboldtii]|nr:hypothetical protein HKX48_009089 [Thoreauomyces humboldtii]
MGHESAVAPSSQWTQSASTSTSLGYMYYKTQWDAHTPTAIPTGGPSRTVRTKLVAAPYSKARPDHGPRERPQSGRAGPGRNGEELDLEHRLISEGGVPGHPFCVAHEYACPFKNGNVHSGDLVFANALRTKYAVVEVKMYYRDREGNMPQACAFPGRTNLVKTQAIKYGRAWADRFPDAQVTHFTYVGFHQAKALLSNGTLIQVATGGCLKDPPEPIKDQVYADFGANWDDRRPNRIIPKSVSDEILASFSHNPTSRNSNTAPATLAAARNPVQAFKALRYASFVLAEQLSRPPPPDDDFDVLQARADAFVKTLKRPQFHLPKVPKNKNPSTSAPTVRNRIIGTSSDSSNTQGKLRVAVPNNYFSRIAPTATSPPPTDIHEGTQGRGGRTKANARGRRRRQKRSSPEIICISSDDDDHHDDDSDDCSLSSMDVTVAPPPSGSFFTICTTGTKPCTSSFVEPLKVVVEDGQEVVVIDD